MPCYILDFSGFHNYFISGSTVWAEKEGLTFPLINLNPKFFSLLFRNEAKSSYRFSVLSLLASKFDGFWTSGILNMGSTFVYLLS